MTDDERALASLKLLRQSSAWMVGVQTAFFGFLVTLLNNGLLALGSYLIKGAVISFLLSIIFAGVVLSAIPWVPDRTPPPTSIRRAPIAVAPLFKRLSIGFVSGLQYTAFVIGIVCLIGALINRKIG